MNNSIAVHNIRTIPVIQYLNELRLRGMYIIVAWCITCFTCYVFSEELLYIIARPLQTKLIYTHITEAFTTYIRLSIIISIFCAIPYTLYQLYMFIRPGLYLYEKKILRLICIVAACLYICSFYISYTLLIPIAFQFFLGFQRIGADKLLNIELQAKVNEYVILSTKLFMILGLCFQMPIILILIWYYYPTVYNWSIRKRRIVYVAIVIIATIFSPPDIISQIMILLMLLICIECSYFSIRLLMQYNQRGDDRN